MPREKWPQTLAVAKPEEVMLARDGVYLFLGSGGWQAQAGAGRMCAGRG